MQIKELIERLIEKTNDDTYKWEYQRDNLYRLVVPFGSISIERVWKTIGSIYVYDVGLYDKDSCFARYDSQKNKDVQFEALYKAIIANRNRVIEKKIDDVFGDI